MLWQSEIQKTTARTLGFVSVIRKRREGKRIRKRFSTKGEAITFERFTMKEMDNKPWLGQKEDNRRLTDLLDLWWVLHGHSSVNG